MPRCFAQETGYRGTHMGPDCGPMREILPTMTGGDRQRILIVEDNDDLRTYLEGLLKEEYLVQTCSNGRDALLVAREYNPDLILSDVMMPEMGGDELCASVKSDIETSHIPVMLLTPWEMRRTCWRGWKTELTPISPNRLA